jgi:hypothetical protein
MAYHWTNEMMHFDAKEIKMSKMVLHTFFSVKLFQFLPTDSTTSCPHHHFYQLNGISLTTVVWGAKPHSRAFAPKNSCINELWKRETNESPETRYKTRLARGHIVVLELVRFERKELIL